MNRILAELGDDLDELLNSPIVPADERKAPPAHYKPASFDDPCPKCRGRGRFISYNGRDCGPCFTCKGKGKKTFATSPEKRAQARATAARRPVNNWEAFAEAHVEVAAWILSAPDFAFATAMKQAVERFGSLTVNQLAACERCIQGRAKAQAARAERQATVQAAAPVISTAKIEEAFATAVENGKKTPKLRLDTFKFSLAPAHSKNAGAIYVKEKGEYLGKIKDGRFFTVFACDDGRKERVLAAAADPAAAAIAYGRTTGSCSCCGAELTNKLSIELGIGPICREKYGF